MVQKIKEKNMLKIPDLILDRVGLHKGDYVEVTDDGYKIIITPKTKEETFNDEEFKKLEKLADNKKNKSFKDGNELLLHLEKISKK
ncbi:hypothetical protein A2230_09245 [candidate division WOR-1 bacterium RIFOXYA2_FULL_36_21]|uniref:SpoVT-AbrB domain-containing protein n=1 Tax=candidate division WOR-1 bacterium RIFOXYB2_FULL_36_35 TaxID=1802578 RepID=A0A1F4S5M0_UNCSA|nr:MAG: hypothetical protein A2230_09245 [candidate division WOR-1 bacterium RIFOXYA2_FULL_36_21]OGC15043.1 MAG: hypothetical protein A2290_09065 [candidate division WOR-1 bacterium RIFOXYB2_FULL_36_35]OGC18833.1 MAG: hypothetical protein A2282_05650 [candidate division WOR-1 bacterium RIFOXYA12_FULL_36_13]